MATAGAMVTGRDALASSGELELAIAGMRQGNRRGDLARGFAGADCRGAGAAVCALSGRPRLFPGSAAVRPGVGGGISRRDHADFGGAELSGNHQGIPLSPAPDGLLDSGQGPAAGGAGGSALGSPTFGKRNTLYVGALRPWQLLIPPGVGHGYKVIGKEDSLLVYMTDRFYNPKDEGRIPYNDHVYQLRLGDAVEVVRGAAHYNKRQSARRSA